MKHITFILLIIFVTMVTNSSIALAIGSNIDNKPMLFGYLPISKDQVVSTNSIPSKPLNPPDLLNSTDAGLNSFDNITNISSPTFLVECTLNDSTITMYIDHIGTANDHLINKDCTSTGLMGLYDLVELVDGSYDIYYTESSIGGESELSDPLRIEVDLVSPEAVSLTFPTVNSPSNGQFFSGLGEAGARVSVNTPSGAHCESLVDELRNWNCTLEPLPLENELVLLYQEDFAGNKSPTINEPDLIDTNVPLTVVITSPKEGDRINQLNPIIKGQSQPGTHVYVTINNGQSGCDVFTDEFGVWSCTAVNSLSEGQHTIKAVYGDGVDIQEYTVDVILETSVVDMSVEITNCIKGTKPSSEIVYQMIINNQGNQAIDNVNVKTFFTENLVNISWECLAAGGGDCGFNQDGEGNLNELVNFPVGSIVSFLFTGQVNDQTIEIIIGEGELTFLEQGDDVNLSNNSSHDYDLVYNFLQKSSFECNVPGSYEDTVDQLNQ